MTERVVVTMLARFRRERRSNPPVDHSGPATANSVVGTCAKASAGFPKVTIKAARQARRLASNRYFTTMSAFTNKGHVGTPAVLSRARGEVNVVGKANSMKRGLRDDP